MSAPALLREAGFSDAMGAVAVVVRGDAKDRAAATVPVRLAPVLVALAHAGVGAELVVYHDDRAAEIRRRLARVDGVLVWVDPVAGDGDRIVLDGILREVAADGVWVGSHPDVIAKMGTKEVLVTTRELGWGSDAHLYRTPEEFRREFPARLAADRVRVLKPRRGNGGLGVYKVTLTDPDRRARPGPESRVRAQHALIRDEHSEDLSLGELMARCDAAFTAYRGTGSLVDQAFCRRIDEGIIRSYLVGDRVVGFARQYPKGLSPDERAARGQQRDAPSAADIMGLPSAKTMFAPDHPAFATLRTNLERAWIPAMQTLLTIEPAALPVLWDADFLLGPPEPNGDDTYVLCEINASSVLPFPPEALSALAGATVAAIRPQPQA